MFQPVRQQPTPKRGTFMLGEQIWSECCVVMSMGERHRFTGDAHARSIERSVLLGSSELVKLSPQDLFHKK